MRPVVFLLAAALFLVFSSVLGALPRDTEAEIDQTAAIADCAPTVGAAVQGEHCSQSSLDGTPGTAISHTVLSGACADADLHIVRYVPDAATSPHPVVATFCG